MIILKKAFNLFMFILTGFVVVSAIDMGIIKYYGLLGLAIAVVGVSVTMKMFDRCLVDARDKN